MKIKAALILLFWAGAAMAQSNGDTAMTTQPNGATTTTTTTVAAPTPGPNEVAGTLVSYDATALSLVVATPNSTAPITFTVNSATAFVDEANKPIPGSMLTNGSPVTVYLDPNGGAVVSKVILRKLTRPAS